MSDITLAKHETNVNTNVLINWEVIFSARNGVGPITTFLKFQLCRLVEEEI